MFLFIISLHYIMPAYDTIHHSVKTALIKDGWQITQDPLVISYGDRKLFIDLGAEKLIEAVKGDLKIAVEIKSFLGPSVINEVQIALGQYMMYKAVLEEENIDRILILAIPSEFYNSFFKESLGQLLVKKYQPNLLLVDVEKEEIDAWLPKIE